MSTLQLGPLALPIELVAFALAGGVGLAIGKRAGHSAGIDPEPVLLRMLLLGLVAARLAFVWQWSSLYLQAPWSVLDIRDGGLEAAAGFAVAVLYGMSRMKGQPPLRKPLMGATLATLAIWGTAELTLATWLGGSNEPLPQLSLPALDGNSVALTSFAGKPTVVNLWATWCPPCRREMPLLQQAQAAHPEINFVFVNQGETQDQVVRYLKGQGMTLRNVLIDATRSTGAAFNEAAMPTTLFFDTQGRLASSRIGALSEVTLTQRLDALQGPTTTRSTPLATP